MPPSIPSLNIWISVKKAGHEMDGGGKLSYQGVVFNEMKGAMANPVRAAWKGIEEALKLGERPMPSSPEAIRSASLT